MIGLRSSLSSIIVAGLCSGSVLVGQTVTTGAISGKVTDSGHAPVVGAVIRATSGQVTRTVTTNAEGSFTLSLLNGGPWSLQVTKPGFATANKSVQVMVNSMTPTSFRIAKESAAVVEVVATSSTIDTSSTTTGSSFAVDTLAQMPVAGDMSSIAMLTPGVTTSGFKASDNQGLDISIAGASGAENSFSIDGLKTNDMRYGGQGIAMPSEFIDQVDIQTGGFKPEFSALGGVFNATTKSGSNDFQGSAWAYLTPSGLKPAAKANPYYQETPPTTVYESGAWAGGPIVKDKLFYSVGLSYQHTGAPAYANLSGNTVGADAIANTTLLGKLNYFITADNQLTFSYFSSDKTDDRDSSAGYADGYGDADSGRSKKTNSSNLSLVWDATLASNVSLSTKIGRAKLDYKVNPYDTSHVIIDATYYTTGAGAGISVPYGTRYYSGGYGSSDHETNITNQFSTDLSWILGTHALKFGYSYMGSQYTFDDENSQGYSIYVSSAYVGRTIYSNHSDAKANFQAIYAQDVWQMTNGLNVFYGFRTEQQEQKSGLDGHTFMKFKFQDYIQPRLGFTWDVGGKGLSKLSGSLAQYYEQIPQRIAVRTYGNEQYYRDKYYGATYDATTRAVDWSTASSVARTDYSTGWSNDPIQDGLKLPKRVEVKLGYDHQVSTTTSLGIHATYRKLTDVIEDSVLTDAAGGTLDTTDTVGQAILWNPKKGKVSWTNTSGQKVTVENTTIPEAYNEYKSVDVSYTRKTADNLIFIGYTWSRNYGTYEGLISPSNGQADGNITASYDYYSYVGTGLLPTDHTHSLKAYGYQKFHFRDSDVLTVGFNLQVQSGVPYSYKDNGASSGSTTLDVGGYGNAVFENGKMGNKGRTPTTKKVDLTLQYETHLTPKVSLEPLIQVFNVTSCRVATEVDQEATDAWGNTKPTGQWSSATAYQEGRSVRFGARLKF